MFIRRPFEGTGEVGGFVLEIVVVLVEKLDRQKIERLRARGAATRGHAVVAVGAGTEGGDILFGVARADHDAEIAGVGGPVVAPGARHPGVEVVISGQAAVFPLDPDRGDALADLERADRAQIDRAADGTFDGFRFRRLGDFDRGDDRRGDIFKIDAGAPGAGIHRGHAVDFGAVRVGAADLHAGADAGGAGDLDAGHILKHFRQILVGQFADVFGLDDFHEIGGIALLIEGALQGSADAGDQYLLNNPATGDLAARWHARGHGGQARKQRNRQRLALASMSLIQRDIRQRDLCLSCTHLFALPR